MRLIRLSIVALLAVAGFGPAVRAEEAYPSRSIRIIVPFPAGATTDFLGRLLAEYLRTKTGQQVVVENVPGAAGALGMAATIRAAPDGYTILVTGSSLASASLLSKISFDPLTELVPVGIIGRIPTVYAVHKDIPAKTLKEFTELVRKEPSKINFVTPGKGTPPHVAALELSGFYGLDIQHIPYRGAAPAITDLIAGRGHLIGIDPGPLLQHIRAGTLRALAVAADKRIAALPDVPTADEAGFTKYQHYAWWGAFVPRGTPPAVIDKLNALMQSAVNDPAVKQKLLAYHVEPLKLSPTQMAKLVNDEYAKMSGIVAKYKIKLD
jgi:tripartite-type tricarboxylate transporter receptor subunit TctC